MPAGLPKAIVADTEVLKNAPMEMIKAGFGDIIGKYSALNDWKLARAVNGEYFCDYIYNVTYEMIDKTLKTAKGLLNREEESVKAVTEALMIVGIMMSFALSLDDFIISYFVSSADFVTLPLYIYNQTVHNVKFSTYALCTLIIVVILGLLVAVNLAGTAGENRNRKKGGK